MWPKYDGRLIFCEFRENVTELLCKNIEEFVVAVEEIVVDLIKCI